MGARLFLILLLFSFSQFACEEGRGVISDINPDISVSSELYVMQGNTLYALKDNRIPNQDFSKNNEIDPFWTSTIPGNLSISTPFLIAEGTYQENKIYVSSGGGWVYKYSDSGNLIWSYDTGGEISASVHVATSNRSSEPFVPFIYVGNKNGRFVCLDGVDGAIVWEHQIPNGAGIESSAQLARQGLKYYIIFGADDGYIYAFDAANGNEEWSFYTGASIKSKGESHRSGMNFIVGNIAGDVFNMDVSTGNVVWSKKLPDAVLSTPESAFKGDLILGCNDGNLYCLRLDTGDILWQFQTGGAIYSAPFYKNIFESPNDQSNVVPMAFFSSFDEHLYALNAESGSLIWKKDLEAGQLAASPVAVSAGDVNSMVYMNTSRGLVSVYSRTGEFQSIFENSTEGNYTSSVMPYVVLREGTIPVGLTEYPNNLN